MKDDLKPTLGPALTVADAVLASLDASMVASASSLREARQPEGLAAVVTPGRFEFVAILSGSEKAKVTLGFSTGLEVWSVHCKRCGSKAWCHHAVCALMAIQSVDVVIPGLEGIPRARPPKAAPMVPTDLRTWIAMNRKATRDPEELKKLGQIRQMYSTYRNNRNLFSSDYLVGLWLGWGQDWKTTDLSGLAPADELEFFFGFRVLSRARGRTMPEFLEELPVPDGGFQERLAEWEANLEAHEWCERLAPLVGRPQEKPLRWALRFRLDPDKLVPEVRDKHGDWRDLKNREATDLADGSMELESATASMLWHSFQAIVKFASRAYRRSCDELHPWLASQLRQDSLRTHFVDAAGCPLEMHPQPLRWRMAEPSSQDPRYHFELVDADGNSPGNLLCHFAGSPMLYLTSRGLFEGPPVLPGTLASQMVLSVPARAVESRMGLALLDRIGVPLPARIEQRTVTVHLIPRIAGRMVVHPGSNKQRCALSITAACSDGSHLHRLMYSGWSEAGGIGRRDSLIRINFSSVETIPALLRKAGFDWDSYSGCFEARATRTFPLVFRELLDQLHPSTQFDLQPPLDSIRGGEVVGSVELEVEEKEVDWFDLKVVVKAEDTSLTQDELAVLLAAKGGWVDLKGKGWRRLKFNLTDQQEEDLARIGLTARELSAEPQRFHALQLATPAVRKFLPDQTATQVERRASELQARVTPTQPAVIHAELRPYQLEGFHFLAYLVSNGFGGVLADDMGLGKTVQTLTWLAWLRTDGAQKGHRNRPSLVICPKSVQDNWRSEAARFYPELRVQVWGPETLKQEKSFTAADLHILNYAQMRAVEDRLQNVRFLAAILDEGQNIKNPSSQSAQVARSLQASHRLVLTGTPIENRLMDLWSLMAFAMPGVLGPRSSFGRLYDAKGDPWARTRLAARLRPFLLRRTKSQVAPDLPDRQEEDLYCEMEGEQRTLYLAELKVARRILLKLKTPEALNRQRFHLLTSLLRLRQICCHPRLHRPESKQPGAKLEALLETLEPLVEQGEKVLVFSQFVDLLGILKEAFAERQWAHWFLAGQTENRGDLVREFQGYEGGGVFLISLKAGGSGLNLTAASYVVLFDPWWNPAVENQAIDRTHRIGQTRKILAYRLLIKDSIEEKIRQLQRTKSSLAAEVLGEERFSEALTLDDLKFLLAEPAEEV
jgi:hypothetical protein